MNLTNRFHVAVRLFSSRSQRRTKCGKNKKVAIRTLQSLRAAIGPLQFSLRHWNFSNLTSHSGILHYNSLEIFSACTAPITAELYNAAASPASRLLSAGSLAINFQCCVTVVLWRFSLTDFFFILSNGNRNEWSPIRSVIIRVMTKPDDRAARVRFVYHNVRCPKNLSSTNFGEDAAPTPGP